jgi:hypothetical protein
MSMKPPFHGGNTGSSPVGRANDFNDLADGKAAAGRVDKIFFWNQPPAWPGFQAPAR